MVSATHISICDDADLHRCCYKVESAYHLSLKLRDKGNPILLRPFVTELSEQLCEAPSEQQGGSPAVALAHAAYMKFIPRDVKYTLGQNYFKLYFTLADGIQT